jgi:hypothetical protein
MVRIRPAGGRLRTMICRDLVRPLVPRPSCPGEWVGGLPGHGPELPDRCLQDQNRLSGIDASRTCAKDLGRPQIRLGERQSDERALTGAPPYPECQLPYVRDPGPTGGALRTFRTALVAVALLIASLSIAPSVASAATNEAATIQAEWRFHGYWNSEGWCDITRTAWVVAGYPTLPTSGCWFTAGGGYYFYAWQD